jgi:excisionase family DNA binding protein
MNRRQIQFGVRENTASSRQHASRFAVHPGPDEFSRRGEGKIQASVTNNDRPCTGYEDAQHAATRPAATAKERRDENSLLTVQEVAELLQVPVSWVYERVRKRSPERLPCYRLGKYWRFRELDLLAWIERQRVGREHPQIHDEGAAVVAAADSRGRVSREGRLTRPHYQEGCLWTRGKRRKMWVLRWREDVMRPDGSVRRIQRAETLGPVSKITQQQARAFLQERVVALNQSGNRPQVTMPLEEFVRVEWLPSAALALKKSSVKFYNLQLGRHILPAFGSSTICEINRVQIEALLSGLKQKGHANGMLRGVRSTFSTVFQAAVRRGYLDKNPAHGIRIRATAPQIERRFYFPAQIRQLLPELTKPCSTVVQLAVLTGLRIGEILALRWKRVDLLRRTIEVAESYSDGDFGTPKTRSSNRVIPISGFLRRLLESHRAKAKRTAPDDLVLCMRSGAPLNQKNLYHRVLGPACDRIQQPRVSWDSFRHTHATLLTEVGESIKTVQAQLGHSDLQTTLNTYAHVIPDSQRRGEGRVARILNLGKISKVGKSTNRKVRT